MCDPLKIYAEVSTLGCFPGERVHGFVFSFFNQVIKRVHLTQTHTEREKEKD